MRVFVAVSVLVAVFAVMATAAGNLGGVNILAFTKYTDVDEEWANVKFILETERASITETDTTDPNELASLLKGKDVFLIPEQEYADSSGQLRDLGETWASVLTDFLMGGGRIVGCTGLDLGVNAILWGAGISSAEAWDDSFVDYLQVADPSDPLILQPLAVTSPFDGVPNATNYFTDVDSDARVIVQDSDGDWNAFVIDRWEGGGDIIVLGFDYYEYNDSTRAILVNSCAYRATPPVASLHLTGTLPPTAGTYDAERYVTIFPMITLIGISIEGQVDAYLRLDSPVPPGGSSFDYAAFGEQQVALSPDVFQPGAWFLAVANETSQTQSYTVDILPIPTVIDVGEELSYSAEGTIGATPVPAVNRYLSTEQGMVAIEQYLVEIDREISSLYVRVAAGAGTTVYLRRGVPVEVAGGRVVADAWAPAVGEYAAISLAGNLLARGTYYIAVEGPISQAYSIEIRRK